MDITQKGKKGTVGGLKDVQSLCTSTSCHPMFFRGLYVLELWLNGIQGAGGMRCPLAADGCVQILQKQKNSSSQVDELQVHPQCNIHINDVAWRHPLIVEK